MGKRYFVSLIEHADKLAGNHVLYEFVKEDKDGTLTLVESWDAHGSRATFKPDEVMEISAKDFNKLRDFLQHDNDKFYKYVGKLISKNNQ